MSTIKIAKASDGTTTVTGLSDGDVRVLAMWLQDAVETLPPDDRARAAAERFAVAFRSVADTGGARTLIGGTCSMTDLYQEGT